MVIAQGEPVKTMLIGNIIAAETSAKNAARVFEKIAKCLRFGYSIEQMRAEDCSGLGLKFFITNGLLKYDTTADGLYHICKDISLEDTRPGDMVFIENNKGIKTHVGYVVNDGYVIESAGRDYGVIKGTLAAGSPVGKWKYAGRPPFWEEAEPKLTRILKMTEPQMKGDDVKDVQKRLDSLGYKVGNIDGVYGNKTCIAVKAFQGNMGLDDDGKVGPITADLLGLRWKTT